MLWWKFLVKLEIHLSLITYILRNAITGSKNFHFCNFMHIARLPSRKAIIISMPTASTWGHGWSFFWSMLCDYSFCQFGSKMIHNVNSKYFKENVYCFNDPIHTQFSLISV